MSELRQDLVSGDWIISATERAKRPHGLLQKKKVRKPSSISSCPFEDMKKSGNWPPIALIPNEKSWRVAIIPNKYPALRHENDCAQQQSTEQWASGGERSDVCRGALGLDQRTSEREHEHDREKRDHGGSAEDGFEETRA